MKKFHGDWKSKCFQELYLVNQRSVTTVYKEDRNPQYSNIAMQSPRDTSEFDILHAASSIHHLASPVNIPYFETMVYTFFANFLARRSVFLFSSCFCLSILCIKYLVYIVLLFRRNWSLLYRSSLSSLSNWSHIWINRKILIHLHTIMK